MIRAKTVASLFRYEKRWIKGEIARAKCGINMVPTNSTDPDACQWCLLGAIYKVYPDNTDEIISKLCCLIGIRIANWNDVPERTFKQVKALVKKAGI